jgi:hypothetical protein
MACGGTGLALGFNVVWLQLCKRLKGVVWIGASVCREMHDEDEYFDFLSYLCFVHMCFLIIFQLCNDLVKF